MIDPLPPAPSRANDDPQTFSDKADAFAASLEPFRQQLNSAVVGINFTTSVPMWVATTTYSRGDAVWSPVTYLAYRLQTATLADNAANQDPSIDTTNWRQATGTGNVSSGATASFTTLTATTALNLPVGATGGRPAMPQQGTVRFNTSLSQFEGYNGTDWGTIGGGATGGGSDQIFQLNGKTVTTSYSIPSDKNAMSVGPIPVSSGQTVTVPSGSRWVVL